MSVPPAIRAVQDGVIATFPAEEIASGFGILTLYAFVGDDASGQIFGLTEDTSQCFPAESTPGSDATTTYTFTSPAFNLPRFVKGSAFANVALSGNGTSGSATFQLQHWTGSAATNLTAESNSSAGVGAAVDEKVSFQLPITTEKMVKKGEFIRAIIKVTIGSGGFAFGHSPGNQTTAINLLGTRTTIGVPFRSGS